MEAFLDAWLERRESPEIPVAEIKRVVEEALAQAEPDKPRIRVPTDIVKLRRTLGKETDRGCALASAAYLETEIRHLLRAYLVDDEQLAADLLEGAGPLSSFAATINLACGLGLIARGARRDLHLIRRVRNMFAHQAGQISFDDEPIASRCGELYYDLWQESMPPRDKFIRVTMGILGAIIGKKANVRHRRPAKEVDLSTLETRKLAVTMKKALETKLTQMTTRRRHGRTRREE